MFLTQNINHLYIMHIARIQVNIQCSRLAHFDMLTGKIAAPFVNEMGIPSGVM